jgi:hypothetical protein
MPLLIFHLQSLNLSPHFIKFIFKLFSRKTLHFFSSFSSINVCSTSTGLPQGSCLSPIIFNIYMSSIVKHLNSIGHKVLVYADDIVISSHNSHLDLAIDSLHNSFNSLHNILSSSFFHIAQEKCKSLIFSRCRYLYCHPTKINDHTLPFVSNHTYLGLTFDPKLRWSPNIIKLTKFTSR